jgi:SulP family sulfate permease
MLAYFPKAVLGGLLLFLGLDFLSDWVIGAWKRFTRVEFGVILLIVSVIAATDFLIGVGVGLVAMIIMFVVSYSRINVIHHTLSGSELQSNVERNPLQRRVLTTHGDAIYILELRGFLFFGTAHAMLDHLRMRVQGPGESPVRYILLDFENVTGMDTSAALSFLKAAQFTKKRKITLGLSDLSTDQRKRLERGGLRGDDSEVIFFRDLDHGLEWCEDRILEAHKASDTDFAKNLVAQLRSLGFSDNLATRLPTYLEPASVQPGEHLIHKGEPADCLYYIERGKVSVYLEQENGDRIRLRTLAAGATVGEMGLYTGSVRTAEVIADEPTITYRLTQEAIAKMTRSEPELSAGFHKWIAQLLSERLAQATRSIEALKT